ncbi:sulfotransferase [Verrucomicrobiaceae bacterium 5K15]|uniref:Sulfotransferase n=1 Tax=Oceaniferula flava TaxID=2800421 RepID=A0AAE2V954_9BACT|nr:sulfotransferase domain-containing protein [Oceaniferula flavus]MBK1856512.1 sulfotransferase [Oceaniferula flavus]MBM1137819.1 sulfotransferase [Oceaniferula flavus]
MADNSKLSKGPTFIVIGSAKSGTTTLCDQLAEHPEVFVTSPKEPKFFSDDDYYHDRPEQYFSLYAKAHGAKARGEGSVSYTIRDNHPQTAERIYACNTDIRLIYIVRHPVKRLISHYRMYRKQYPDGKELSDSLNDPALNAFLIQGSSYQWQLDAYLEYFSEDAIKVVFLEDMASDGEAVLRECYEHIGVDVNWKNSNVDWVANKSDGRGFRCWLAKTITHIPGYRRLKALLPREMILKLKDRYGLIPPSPKIDIPDDCLEYIGRVLEKRSRDFLVKYGKPANYWTYQEQGSITSK